MTTKIHSFFQLPRALLDARASFDCGTPALNLYLVQTAAQHEAKNITRTFCGEQDGRLFGYYSMTNAEVDVGALPPELVKKYKLPTHRLPVVRLARLAVDIRFQAKGLGSSLMIDAMARVMRVAESSGCLGLTVDAQDEKAAGFYESLGFRQAPDKRLLLFMPLPEIQGLFHGS
jgi:ribosomal protein S18 acetylase RimI-like enzyme